MLLEALLYVTLFYPHHLMIVTDARCSFFCAHFTKTLTEHKLAKVVGLGGYPLDTEVTFNVASYVGGTKIAVSTLYSKKFAPPMPSINSDFTYVGINARRTLYDYRNESLEFKVVQPDLVLKYYLRQDDSTVESMIRVLKMVKPYTDHCFGWEVNSTDFSPTSNVMENALYGHPCKEERKGFDETKCVFRHCKEGYYLDAQKKCSQIPVVDLRCNIV